MQGLWRYALLAGIMLILALPGAAAGQRSKVLADCKRNDGVVAGKYTVGQLKAAYRSIPESRRVSSNCGQSVASHLAAKRGLRGGRKAGDVLEDCTRHGGRLTLRFAPHALTRAATRMTRARRDQTRCLIGILSQLRARERPIAVTRPKAGAVDGPYDAQTGAQLRDSLARYTAALRRPAVPRDAIPQNIIDELVRRNRAGAGFDFFTVRRVGPGDVPIWLITADGRMCGIRWFGPDAKPAIRCVAANRWARGEGVLRVLPHSDASHDVWGVIPDAFHDGTLLFGDATSRPLATDGNGVLDPLERIPGAVEWSAYGGRQWYDTTRLPCITNCLDVPPIAGVD